MYLNPELFSDLEVSEHILLGRWTSCCVQQPIHFSSEMLASRIFAFSAGRIANRAIARHLPAVGMPQLAIRHFTDKKVHDDMGSIPIQDIANSIDTTLTPEQQAYVNKLKKSMKGGANSPRCKYKTKINNIYFGDQP